MSARTKILVVHDERRRQVQIKDCLEPFYEVTICGDLTEAITAVKAREQLNTQNLPFDLVLTAVHVNGSTNLSVFDFLKWMKGNPQAKTVPVVLVELEPSKMAQYVLDSVRTAANALGANGFIVIAEFHPDDFRKQIELYFRTDGDKSGEADSQILEQTEEELT